MDGSRGSPLIEPGSTWVGERRKTADGELLCQNGAVISPDFLGSVTLHVVEIGRGSDLQILTDIVHQFLLEIVLISGGCSIFILAYGYSGC